ncbi:MAG: M18 family aminopeptidase [Pseudomonadota bacterium]|nr:M18 family aminopeptidase [Pseudomonadota bacterium]
MPKPLLEFLSSSPTPFHATANIARRLEGAGFTRLREGERWLPAPGERCFVTRNDSSLIAFNLVGKSEESGFRIVGAHTDSPCLKLKPAAISTAEGYARLAVEVYGGALLNPCFDRDLSLAGRVTLSDGDGAIVSRLIDFQRPLAVIPSLAIHLDREANDKRKINKQTDLPALLCLDSADGEAPDFHSLLLTQLAQQYPAEVFDAVLGFELALYDSQPANAVGLRDEFIASARLDNLLSCFAGASALVDAQSAACSILVLNDHEEVGSESAGGAQGPFLLSVLRRICDSEEALQRSFSRSMLISADNAHGVHPNFPDKHEPGHKPMLNAGPVIKINHNQRYATNSETEAVFRKLCAAYDIPLQTFVTRSDLGCGSTLGPLTATRLGVRTLDVGVPQLAMHSIRELAGSRDAGYLQQALKGFYELESLPF